MLPENNSFFVRGEDGQEYGPADLSELREWVRENRAGLGSEVRLNESYSSWKSWQTYPELIALLAEVQVTCPVPGLPGALIAPIWRRAVAWIIDLMLLAILLNPLQILLDHVMPMREIIDAATNPALLQSMSTPLLYQFIAFVTLNNACLVVYFTLCHAAYGKTPAKGLLRINVVGPDGQKPAPVKAFVRALALVLSVNLFFPLILAFFNPQRRTFHDLAANTFVVKA